MVNYNLKEIADILATKAGTKAKLDNKFKNSYIINNVTSDMLTEMNFEYKGLTNKAGDIYPLYKFGSNLEAIFVNKLLYIYEITY